MYISLNVWIVSYMTLKWVAFGTNNIFQHFVIIHIKHDENCFLSSV